MTMSATAPTALFPNLETIDPSTRFVKYQERIDFYFEAMKFKIMFKKSYPHNFFKKYHRVIESLSCIWDSLKKETKRTSPTRKTIQTFIVVNSTNVTSTYIAPEIGTDTVIHPVFPLTCTSHG